MSENGFIVRCLKSEGKFFGIFDLTWNMCMYGKECNLFVVFICILDWDTEWKWSTLRKLIIWWLRFSVKS